MPDAIPFYIYIYITASTVTEPNPSREPPHAQVGNDHNIDLTLLPHHYAEQLLLMSQTKHYTKIVRYCNAYLLPLMPIYDVNAQSMLGTISINLIAI